jgi:glycerophosphoryl diester phosphodiesterase
MAAFETAADAGADGIELDVRLCRSGEVVVFHDPTLARCTGGRDRRSVADLDWSDLSRMDVGDGQTIPLLTQVLAWASERRLRVNVEMKRDVPNRGAVIRETARVLRTGAALPDDIIVSSFDPWMLARFGWSLPGVLFGYLFGSDQRLARSGWPAAVISADAVHPQRTIVNASRCRTWQNRGNLINVWTVNDPVEARALSAMGVDAIITDVPRKIADVVR